MSQHPPEEDQYGYEDAGERWLPVHSVESIVRKLTRFKNSASLLCFIQLLSVISLLSSDKPNLDSPANVDAAVCADSFVIHECEMLIVIEQKEVRENFTTYKKKVRRLARQSADEFYESGV